MRRVLLFVAFVFYFGASANAQSPKLDTKPDTTAMSKPATRPVTGIDAAHHAAAPSPVALNAARASFAKLPLSFEENTGQIDDRVKFTSRGAGYNLFLTGDEAVFTLRGGNASANCSQPFSSIHANCTDPAKKNSSEESVLWMKLLGANSSAQISGSDLLPGKINYYMGNDRSKWRTGVRQYGRVSYTGIYPGVDLTYYGNQQQLESDFILAPGANPRAIEFEVKGARESRLDAKGNLVLITSAGNVQLLRPGIYQVIGGQRREVSGHYVLRAKNQVGFAVGAYDTHEKLIIDPTLVYSTFLGGSNLSGGDSAQAIAIDSTGHAYVTGQGTTADFPGSDTAGPPVSELSDFVFVTEFDPTGSSAGAALVYSTILSGQSDSSIGNGIGLDASGNAYVAGNTSAADFPMVNPFQATYGSPYQSGFVAGLSAGTGTLIYSTFLGGRNATDTTELQGLFADSTGNTYVVGDTQSPNFPTVASSFQSTLIGTQNAVVAKFNNQGQPVYSSYLGGNSYEYGTAIAADSSGNAYVTGYTSSSNFPVQTSPAPFQSALAGGYDVFVSKLSLAGSTVSLAASTYLGGSNTDEAMGIALDTATPPNVYVTGQTSSSGAAPAGFPTTSGVFSSTNGGGTDAFVTKIKGDFTALTYSTYLGGTGTDIGYAIGLDASGNAYITGSTTSTNFPTKLPLQSTLGTSVATNVFLAELNTTGTALNYSTYLGGVGVDVANGIAVDSTGNAYIAGSTTSPNFPVVSGGAAGTSPFQGQLGGSAGNAFVAKISPAAALSALNFFPPNYNFHSDGLGGSLIENVTLSNNTAAVATVSGFAFGGADSGDFSLTAATTPCLTTGSFSLPAGTSCVITVKFTPQDQDARTGTLTVSYNSTSTAVMNLSGTGGAPEVSLSTTSIAFGNDPLNVVDSYAVSVTNTGGAPLQIGSAQISASPSSGAAPYSIVANESSCFTAAIAPGNSCYIYVQFLPTTSGTFNASVLINSNAAGSPATLAVSGTGVQEVVVEPASLELGIQIAGSTSTENQNEAYLVNGSGETINVTVTPGTGADQGDFHISNINGLTSCATVGALAPGGTCYLVVLFQPTAASAKDGRTGSYTFAWTGTSIASVVPGSQVVNVMGTGVTGISLYTNSITGPNEYVGFKEGSAGLEYIANGSPSAITVTTALSGNNSGDFTDAIDPSCAPGGVVPAETYCSVTLTFTPSALGLRSATVAFNYTGASSGQLLLSLSGTGIPGPVFIDTTSNGYVEQASSIAFGSEIISTTTPEKYFIVRNAATTPLTVQSLTGPTNTDFKIASDSTCTASAPPFTIPGGSTCTIGVTFTPSSTGAQESTTIVMTDAYTSTSGADSSSPHTLTLTGIGEPAAITVSVSTGGTSLLDFGNVQINPTTVPQAAIYLTNGGNTSITIPVGGGAVLATGGSSTFTLVTTAGALNQTTCVAGKVILPQGGSCVIGVKFDPTALGEVTSSVTFSDSVSGSHTVNIQGNGVGQGSISLSTSSLVSSNVFSFTQLENTTSTAQLATVANIGSGPLTINSLTSTGTNISAFTVSAPPSPTPLCTVGLVIAAGSTCQMSVTFTAPATSGYSYDDFSIRADLGNNATGYVEPDFTGQSVSGGFSLSPAGPIAFGSVAVGSPTDSAFYYLTNNNLTSVTFGQMTVPTGYSIVTDSCSLATVTATNECYFEISFSPASGIPYNGNLTLPYTGATGTPYTVAITGTGSTAVVANPNPVNFTNAYTGSAILNQVTISNGSASAATITGISAFTGANPSDFSIPSAYNTCPNGTVVNPSGGSCYIYVQFQSSVSGNFTAQFTVSYSIGGVAQTPITVVANASIPFSIVTATPNPLVFSTSQTLNTQSQTMYVTLANSASATQTAYVSTVQISGNDFSLASPGIGNCYSVAAGSSCTIPIVFTPSVSGARTGTLTITDNSTTSPHIISLQGSGVAGTVSASPASLSFPLTNVGTSVTEGAILSNTTGSAITINSVIFSGPYATDTGAGTCVDGNKVGAVTGTCVVYIKFTPTSTTNAGSATVNYTVGAGPTTGSVVITLSGAGTNPNVNVNPSSIAFGAQAVGTSSAAAPVTLSNPTGSAVTVSSLPSISGTNASDFSLGTNTCTSGLSLPATTGSCVVNVIFKPGVSGGNSRSATLSITNSSNGTLTVALSGTATQPVAGLNNSSIAFGSLDTGVTSGQQFVTLTNTGNGALNISSVVLGGTNSGDFAQATPSSGTDCRTVGSLAASASCNVAATFTPTATGSRSATITITDNATPTTQVITITGTGTVPAVSLAPTTIALGNQFLSTTSAQFTSVLTNSGSGPLTITSVAIDNTSGNFADFALVTPSGTGVADCRTTTTLQALGTCTIAATFTPSAVGARTATVKITDSAAGSPQLLPLTGTGTAPITSFNPATTLAFGNEIDGVKSGSQIVTLTNTGTASLTLASAVIDPTSTNPGDFAIVSGAGTTCTAGAVISSTAGSNSCTVTLTFTPGAEGARSASLKFTDNSNGTTGSTQSVSLTGTGQTPPTATVAPTSIPFANQRQGTSSAATTVTITNSGDATLTLASIALDVAGNPGDFVLAAGATTPCPLGGGAVTGHSACTFTVAFKPTTTGARTGTVDITDNGNATGTAGTKQTVALTGTGTAPSVQLVSTLAFNNQPVNLTATLPITLKNNGTDTLNLAATNAMAITASTDSSFFGVGTSGQGTTCANSSAIAAGSTCTIVVTFSPTTVRSYGPVTLVITDDAGAVAGSTQSVSITGAGVTSTVNFNPTTIAFGNQRTGVATAQMTSVLTNSGSTALTITSATLTGTNPGDFTLVTPTGGATDCRTIGTVAPAATCTIAATFAPTATGGRSATVSVADSATGSPHTLSLTGTGTAPTVSLSSTSVTFANQIQTTTSAVQTLTLTNTGTAVLNISTVALGGTNPADFAIVAGSGSTCAGAAIGFTAPNNTCTIALTFTPPTANLFSATLTFTDDASPTTQVVNLSGTGLTPPTATPSVPSLTFTSQATTTTSAAQTITLSNTGGAPLSVTSITLAGPNATDFAFASPATTCPISAAGQVAAGSSCVLSVTFSPKAQGTRTANIAIVVTGIANPAAITLTGTGTAPDLAITKTHTGSFEVGVNNTYAIKLTNNGTATTQQQITVTDTLPAGLSYVSASPAGWSCSAGAQNAQIVTCTNAGPIATSASSTLTLTVSVGAAAYPSVTNSATVADAGDSGTNDKTATDAPTAVTAPDVTITSTHTGDFTVGSNGTYTIKATNGGTGPTTGNVVVTDTLPANLSYVSGTGTGWACVAGAQNAQIVTCTYTGTALAAAGGNSSFTLTAAVAPAAFPSVINNATVFDPNDGKTTDKSAAPDTTNIDNVVPAQSSFTPNLGLIAGATTAQQIVITGTGFNTSTQITLGTTAPLNAPLTGTPNAAGTTLTVSVPVADLAAANAGTLTLTVTNPKNPTSNLGGGVAATTQSFPLVGMQGIAPSSSTPTPVPVVAGTPYMLQMNLNLSPSGAVLPADVTITCALPAGLTGATCSPSPATIAHGTAAASADTTITINAVATKNGSSGSAPFNSHWHGQGPWSTYLGSLVAMCLLGTVAMFGSVRQRILQLRQAPMYLVLGILVIAAGALVGCASSGPTPTPVGPSTMTVTATTADGASVTTTVNINISN